ncbi:CSC1-like protein [Drosera capensis]
MVTYAAIRSNGHSPTMDWTRIPNNQSPLSAFPFAFSSQLSSPSSNRTLRSNPIRSASIRFRDSKIHQRVLKIFVPIAVLAFLVLVPVSYSGKMLDHVVYKANKLAKLVDEKMSSKNWPTYYENKYEPRPSKKPTTKTGFCGLWGARVDTIDYYKEKIEKLSEQEAAEREKVQSDPKAVLPGAFDSFRSRWGAAVCAQTEQSSDPTIWLTEWAPEPSDVYWNNLAIPYFELSIRRLLMAVAFFFLVFFYMVPIAFVQSLANIDGMQKALPFLRPLIATNSISAAPKILTSVRNLYSKGPLECQPQ